MPSLVLFLFQGSSEDVALSLGAMDALLLSCQPLLAVSCQYQPGLLFGLVFHQRFRGCPGASPVFVRVALHLTALSSNVTEEPRAYCVLWKNPRTTGVEGDFWSSSTPPLLSGFLTAGSSGKCPGGSVGLQRKRLSGQLGPKLCHSNVQQFFLTFWFVPCALFLSLGTTKQSPTPSS